MKKIVIIISVILIGLCIIKEKTLPQETIRFRIIANSNSIDDQTLKKEILKEISNDLINNKISNIEEERNYLNSKLPSFESKIKEKTSNYSINYGNNYFPKKEYKGKKYAAGEYESLVITLGEGGGSNFWCILFPPLCMIDEETQEKTEYKSFIKEVINKYF